MSSTTPRSICILRLSAIGDTCNIVPVVLQLQNAFPDCKLTWIIGKTEHTLLQHIPGVEFIIVDKAAGKKSTARVKQLLRGQSFDVLLHMHASMRANLISRWISAQRRIGFDFKRARDFHFLFRKESIPAVQNAHVLDGFLSFLQVLGITPAPPKWRIPIPSEAREFARKHSHNRTLIISPCSSDRRKNFRNWSVENYARIADYANKNYAMKVILTGGPTALEKQYGEHIIERSESSPQNLIGQTTLPQLMAILETANAIICPDSGPAHMANAAGIPVIGLFATSNRWRTGPYNSQDYAVDLYPQAVEKYLRKTTDQIRWGTRVRAPEAMTLIEFSDVTDALDRVMQTV